MQSATQEAEEDAGLFQDQQQLLDSDEWPDLAQLLALWDCSPHLGCICASKVVNDKKYLRLDRRKVITPAHTWRSYEAF